MRMGHFVVFLSAGFLILAGLLLSYAIYQDHDINLIMSSSDVFKITLLSVLLSIATSFLYWFFIFTSRSQINEHKLYGETEIIPFGRTVESENHIIWCYHKGFVVRYRVSNVFTKEFESFLSSLTILGDIKETKVSFKNLDFVNPDSSAILSKSALHIVKNTPPTVVAENPSGGSASQLGYE